MTVYGDFRGLLLADYNDVLQERFKQKNIQKLRKDTTYGGFYQSASFDHGTLAQTLKTAPYQHANTNKSETAQNLKVKTIVTNASQTIITRPLTAYHSNSIRTIKEKTVVQQPKEVDEVSGIETLQAINSFDEKLKKKKPNRFPGQRLSIY